MSDDNPGFRYEAFDPERDTAPEGDPDKDCTGEPDEDES